MVWTGLVFTVLAVMVGYYLHATRGLSDLAWLGLAAAGALVGAVAGRVVVFVTGMGATGVVQVISGAGNLAPSPSFSYQESLVARGRYADAADAYRDHLALHPEDHDARLALADLFAGHLDDSAAAERVLLEVRQSLPTEAQERRATEGLIDLYGRTGQTGRRMFELARFAERYAGTAAAAAAKRTLAELKTVHGDGPLP